MRGNEAALRSILQLCQSPFGLFGTPRNSLNKPAGRNRNRPLANLSRDLAELRERFVKPAASW